MRFVRGLTEKISSLHRTVLCRFDEDQDEALSMRELAKYVSFKQVLCVHVQKNLTDSSVA